MATDFFLKIDGVQGESQDAKHQGEIEVLSWSWGESNATDPAGSGAGGGAGRPAVSAFTYMARLSAASPVLMQACLLGRRFKSAVVTGRRAGGKAAFEFLTFSMTDVLVESVQESSGGDELPTESVSLGFRTFHVQYRPQTTKG